MKRVLFLGIGLIAALLCVPAVYCQDWNSLREAYAKIGSVKADFLQKRSLPILSKPLLSEGRFLFKVPDSLRWEYRSPLRTVMLQKGSSVRVYSFSEGVWKPEMTQSVEARRMVLAEISHWFQGRFDQSHAFQNLYAPGPPPRVILIPGEGINKFIQRIEIVLSPRPGVIDRVEIEEAGTSRTSIEFRNVEINTTLPSEVFEKP
jgi:outer membrane lipoprotein carrier protein